MNNQSSPDRFLIGIVVGAIALVIIGVVVAVMGGRSPAPVDPNSPAGVVAAYVEATRTGDYDAADAKLSRAAIAQRDRDRTVRRPIGPASDSNVSIAVETTRQTDDSATARLTVTRFYGSPSLFGSNRSTSEYLVPLVREDGAWRINQPIYEYQIQ